jgi:hypothetical protein
VVCQVQRSLLLLGCVPGERQVVPGSVAEWEPQVHRWMDVK